MIASGSAKSAAGIAAEEDVSIATRSIGSTNIQHGTNRDGNRESEEYRMFGWISLILIYLWLNRFL
jgi:hypothetical protein